MKSSYLIFHSTKLLLPSTRRHRRCSSFTRAWTENEKLLSDDTQFSESLIPIYRSRRVAKSRSSELPKISHQQTDFSSSHQLSCDSMLSRAPFIISRACWLLQRRWDTLSGVLAFKSDAWAFSRLNLHRIIAVLSSGNLKQFLNMKWWNFVVGYYLG